MIYLIYLWYNNGGMEQELNPTATEMVQEAPWASSRGRTVWTAILILSALGILIAGYLTYVHIAQAKPYCAGLGDCERVNTGPYSQIAGIPVALLGLLAYAALFGAALIVLRGGPGAEMAALAVFGLALFGVLFSGYLTYLEIFIIRAICPWCVASAITITLIFLLSIGQVRALI
ncbi:MAG: vitamin K epoxide reductase [Chloroflexota bacterium]